MSSLIPAVTKLSSSVIRILGCNPGSVTLQGTNTYLIGSGKDRILLDAGDKDVVAYQKNLSDVLQSEKANIEHIVVSHWHHDHIGGVENLYGTIAKKPTIWKHKKNAEDTPDDELPTIITNKWLSDGQEISVEGATVKIHHTPGHTTDHVVLTLAEENVLFSGDCVLGEGSATFEEDLLTGMRSLQKILDMKPSVIYPGHGDVVERPIETIKSYLANRYQRENEILGALKNSPDKPLNAMDLVMLLYEDTDEDSRPATAFYVAQHLTKLTKEHKITNISVDDEDRWQFTDHFDYSRGSYQFDADWTTDYRN